MYISFDSNRAPTRLDKVVPLGPIEILRSLLGKINSLFLSQARVFIPPNIIHEMYPPCVTAMVLLMNFAPIVFGQNMTSSGSSLDGGRDNVNFLLPKRRSAISASSMRGRHVIIAAEKWPPWFDIEDRNDGKEPLYSGIMWKMLGYLQESINFTYTIVRPPDGKWGFGDAEGNRNGMLGMVKRKEVEFALGK